MRKLIIMGAAGRDFHNFNVCFRNNPNYKVVAFTAGQLPNIADRRYPPELSGNLYPRGIPIYSERELPELVEKFSVDEVVLSYSDLLYEDVMHKASGALSVGADFRLISPHRTMLKTRVPVISVCASRTGAGKSTVSRRVAEILRDRGVKFCVVRHPMPYGDLRRQIVQRFESMEDLEENECTVEEREEYEPHIRLGNIVYAGVDYQRVLEEAEREADLILWDGGNNDFPFFKSSLYICVVDPLRPADVLNSYPAEINIAFADVIIVNKVNVSLKEDVAKVIENVRKLNPRASLIKTASELEVEEPRLIKDKRVLVVEDGPTVTHGGLRHAAGYFAATKFGAREVVDPRPYSVGSLKIIFERNELIGPILPAIGYGIDQIKDLEDTISKVPCDTVVLGTSSDLEKYISIDKPVSKVRYRLEELNRPSLEEVIKGFLRENLF